MEEPKEYCMGTELIRTTKMIRTDSQQLQFILDNSVGVSPSGCWEWQRHVDKWGYGKLRMGKKMVFAHREIFRLMQGSVANMCVCHSCDNPKCVNPKHLFLGTHQDNSDDKISKRRDVNSPSYINRVKTHCINGHAFTPQNTYTRNRPGGGRICKTCIYIRKGLRYESN